MRVRRKVRGRRTKTTSLVRSNIRWFRFQSSCFSDYFFFFFVKMEIIRNVKNDELTTKCLDSE